MRSSEEGAVLLIGGNGISSGVGNLFHGAGIIGVASLCGGDGMSDWGNGISMGSSMIIGGGLYCSMDEYSRRCNPQGMRGSGGVATRGGFTDSGLRGEGTETKGDRSMRGGDGSLGTTSGSGMTSLGKDEDGWIWGKMTGLGPVGNSGLMTGADGGASGIVTVGPPDPPEELGPGIKMGDGDLLLIVLLWLLRRVRSPSRKV